MTSSRVVGEQRQLISRSLLLASATGLVGILLALSPGKQLSIDIAARPQTDALTIAYMRVLLRTHPENQLIRRALARKLTAIGKWSDARSTLAPLAAIPGAEGFDARLALLEIDRSILSQLADADPQRRRIGPAMVKQIQAILDEPAPPAALESLAQAGRELNRPDLTYRALARLADADPAAQERWLAAAARESLASGSPLNAALAYRTIATREGNPAAVQRHYTLLALDTFIAANEGAAALKFAESIAEKYSADMAVMERIVAIAQSQNAVLDAQRIGRRLLALSPDSPPALEKQLDIELAANDLQGGLSLASRLVVLVPTVQHRTRLAQIAEWNSAQELALTHWTILARLAPTGPAMARALEIAGARGQDGGWLELIGIATRARSLRAEEHEMLLAIAQRTPGSSQLQRYLSAYLSHFAAPLDLWMALIEAHALARDFDAAAATVRSMPAALAGPVESARLEAQLMVRAAQPGDALERLRQVRALASGADIAYWSLLGNLAWESDRRPEAMQAYRAAWDGGADAAAVAERLIEGETASGDYCRVIVLGREAYRRFNDPRWLLLAMDAASRGNQWADLTELLHVAGGKPSEFEPREMYWLLSAHLAAHDGRNSAARAAYQRALLLNPGAAPVRVALLWFEIDRNELLQLAKLLQLWEHDAVGDPAYWAPFAVGMLRLQRANESLPWFQRQMQRTPDDHAWSLEYAKALEDAGRPAAAMLLRRLTYLKLHPRFEAGTKLGAPLPVQLMLPYALLVREFEGVAAAQAILTGMIERGENPAQAREVMVDAMLAQKNFDSARYWLRRARAEQYTLPAWQYLAVAQYGNDRQEIAAILASPATKLSDLDRIGALRKLGWNEQALALAEKASNQPENVGRQAIADAIAQLRDQQSKRVGMTVERRRIGELDIHQFELQGSVPVAAGRVTVRLADIRLGGTTPAIPGSAKEEDLAADAELPFGDGDARIILGDNHRRGDSILYARVGWSRPLLPRVGLRINGAVNALSEESALMRAIGKKNSLTGALTFDLDKSRYARIELSGQRYAMRRDAWLGSGYRIEGELGAMAFERDPLLVKVRLSGSWEENRLATRLPDGLNSFLVPQSATVSAVIPARYGWLGVGGTVFFGDQNSLPGHLAGLIDVVVGKQWPEGSSAYSVRGLLSVPLAAHDAVRFEGFRSNVEGVGTKAANRGIRFSYQHRF